MMTPTSVEPTTGRVPGRILIGWLPLEKAHVLMSGNRNNPALREDHDRTVRAAHKAVESRPRGLDQAGCLREPAPELKGYLQELAANEVFSSYLKEGWRVAECELGRLIVMQPSVYVDVAERRAEQLDPTDAVAIAKVSIPSPVAAPIPAQFDPEKKMWVIACGESSIRLGGNWGGPVRQGIVGFGFAVTRTPAFVQVIEVKGRLFLRDGHHRSAGLVSRGISCAPVMWKRFASFEEVGLEGGLLPMAALQGDRPPLLADYFDDTVSTSSLIAKFDRTILIQAIEITTVRDDRAAAST